MNEICYWYILIKLMCFIFWFLDSFCKRVGDMVIFFVIGGGFECGLGFDCCGFLILCFGVVGDDLMEWILSCFVFCLSYCWFWGDLWVGGVLDWLR